MRQPSLEVSPAQSLSSDPRIRKIQWRDLLTLGPLERLFELTVSAPWLIATWLLLQWGWYASASLTAFFFFLTGLRQVHSATHYTVGFARWVCDGLLYVLSLLMLTSMHAVQVTHMHHHRRCLEESDVEAATAKLSWWRALILGPLHPIRLHYFGFRLGSFRKRCWIVAELIGMAIMVAMALAVFSQPTLKYFLILMATGECLSGFFAVWTVHHGCDPSHIARTQRGWVKNFVSYNMFFHLEHHLFPSVPTCHLPELARRLDRVSPQVKSKTVF